MYFPHGIYELLLYVRVQAIHLRGRSPEGRQSSLTVPQGLQDDLEIRGPEVCEELSCRRIQVGLFEQSDVGKVAPYVNAQDVADHQRRPLPVTESVPCDEAICHD